MDMNTTNINHIEEQQQEQEQHQQQLENQPTDRQQQQDNQAANREQRQQRKKCHGNRKDQRFRRKCRARKIKPLTIEKLLKKRKEKIPNNQSQKNPASNTTTTDNQIGTETILNQDQSNVQENDLSNQAIIISNLHKRKRDISIQELKSMHTRSQPTSPIPPTVQQQEQFPKKMKRTISLPFFPSSSPSPSLVTTMDYQNSTDDSTDNTTIHLNYRRPMYLKRSSKIIFSMLNKRLNYTFKNKDEQGFVYQRLNLLDRQYCLNVDLQLWESYFDIGMEKDKWPSELSKMAQTDDSESYRQYLQDYIATINNQIKKYQIELNKQSEFYSITAISFEQFDQCLNEFVDCQRKYLSIRNNNQLIEFKEDIQERELFEIITTYYQTMDQNIFGNQLITTREKQSKIWKEILQLEMRILCQFLPANFDQLQTFLSPIIYSWPVMHNKSRAIHLKNQHNKIIQEAKRQWLHIFFSIYELQLEEYEQQYEKILVQLKALLVNNIETDGILLFNQIQQYMIYRTNQIKRTITKLMPSFRKNLLQHRQRSSTTTHMIGVSPEPYLDLHTNPFNTQQWKALRLGPSLIRLNQSANRPKKQQNIEIKREHQEIYKKVENHLVDYPHRIPRTKPIFKQYSSELRHQLDHCYFAPISYKDRLQAREQEYIAKSIREIIKKQQLILRIADKNSIFYIGLMKDFEEKVTKFFMETNAFMELSDNPFNETLNKVIEVIKQLRSKQLILKWQYEKIMPDRAKVELAHLYFNPKTHKDDIPVRPIENTMRAITKKISDFLHEIIAPIFNDKCRKTTIIDGAHLIKKFQKYMKRGLFKPSTLFCTFDIHNLYTMLPQDEALNILIEFLYVHGYRKVKGINLDTIRKLASIVLKENVFVYGKKFYRQTTGGAMGSSFTLTLANIFLWKWQKEFVRQQNITREFYGRYIDDIFITWNRSEKDLIKLLDEANTWHPNIKLDYKIGQSLPFLDILLTNNNGSLTTSVYHKQAIEPCVTPFISDHPRHVFVNIIQTALTRAARYSSTFEAFDHERRSIKLMLLYNGYPSTFIDQQFRIFFDEYISPSSSSSFIPFITNEKQLFRLHKKLRHQPTLRQSQVAVSADTANIDNDQIDEDESSPSSLSLSSDLDTSKQNIEQKSKKDYNKLIIHYTHEKRFESFKRDMHQVYEHVFKNTTIDDVKLIVGNRNRRNARHELIRKRPKPSLLTNRPHQKRQRKTKKQTNEEKNS